MARWTLGFLIGVIAITRFSYLPPMPIAWCLIIISFIALVFFRSTHSFLISFIIAFFLGFSYSLIVAKYRIYHYLPNALEGKTLVAVGTIASIPEYQQRQIRFDFLIKEIISPYVSIHYPLRVRLTGYRYSHLNKRPRLQKGESWQFALRLKRPRGIWSPGSFDYQAQLFQENVQATGYIVDRFAPRFIKGGNVYYAVDNLRERLTLNIKKSLNNYPLSGLISALTTGVRYEITEEQWRVMRGTGTNHLFAISGLHLAIIATIIYFVVRFFYSRIPYAVLVMPAPQVASLLTGVLAILYAAVAGFALPVQRALVMLLVFSLGNLCRRNFSNVHAFHCSLLIILVHSPFSVLSASFWLSFMAVALLLYTSLGRLKPLKGWRTWARAQYSVGVGLIPFSLLFFHQISWISCIANILAIPIIGFVILPIALFASFIILVIPSWGSALLVLTERLLEILWQLLTMLSKLKWAHYSASIATPSILFSSLGGILLLLAPQGFPVRFLSVFYLLPLFFWKPDGPKSDEIWFSVLDVGQGLATVVQTQHHTLIYDTGPNRSFDAGRDVLVPFLQKLEIKKINMLIVSHGDNDHIGGADSLLQEIHVENIITSIPKKFLPLSAKFCHEKKRWEWDKVNFEILYPAANDVYLGNNSSCVLKISNRKHSILLTGDIEKEGEDYLVKKVNCNLASTILIVPHHGSKTSSSIEFLNKVKPIVALFSTGYRNQFNLPNTLVIKRYERLKSRIYDTAIDGTITLKSHPDSNIIQIETYHQKNRRFWWK